MITKNTAKILKFLLRNKNETGYNINQIAKAIHISVGSSFKILKEMEKNQVVLFKSIGNGLYYSLNFNNQEAIKLSELLILEEKRNLRGYSKLYAESIQSFEKAGLIILFGSVLSKKEFNDVDVLFVTDKIKEVNNFCLELSKLRTKPVIPLILKKEDLIKEINNKNDAVLSIIKEGVIIKGESIFLEVIKNEKN